MLTQIVRLLQYTEQKATDLDFLEEGKRGNCGFGAEKLVANLTVGAETFGICLEYQGIVPAHPAQKMTWD